MEDADMARIDDEIKKHKERRLAKPDESAEGDNSRVGQGPKAEGDAEGGYKFKDEQSDASPETLDTGREAHAIVAPDAEESEDDGDDSECSEGQRTFLG